MAIGLLVALGGCGGGRDDAQEAARSLADLTARELGSLAARIFEDPGEAESVLQDVGVSVDRLDSLLYEIASDAEASAEYVRGLAGQRD